MSNDDMVDGLIAAAESVTKRPTALEILRYRAEDCRRLADAMMARAKLLDSLAAKLIEMERDAVRRDGGESGHYIGNGSDAEHALYMLASEFRADFVLSRKQ